MKRFLPIILLIAMPIIGLVLGGMVAESMHPSPEIPDGGDAVEMGRWTDQMLENQDKRGKVILFAAFGAAAIGIIGAIGLYVAGKKKP